MSVNGGLVRFIWPTRMLGRGIGLNAMVISISAAVGPSVASAILALGPWPWLFAVNIPIGLAALALASRALPDNPRSGRPFDWVSALLNAGTFGLVILGVDMISRTRSKLAGGVELATGLLFGFILVRREWPMRRPLVPFDLLRDRIFALSVATSIVSFAAQLLAFVSLPFRFENTLHYNQVQTGLLMTPWPVAVGVLAPISGWLSDRFSTAVLCAVGLVLLAGGLFSLAVLPAHPTILDICWRMAICGGGFGIFQAPNNRMMLSSSPRERAGAAGGMLGTARLTGQTSGAVLTAILLHLYASRGEIIALEVAAALAIAAAVISLLRAGKRAKAQSLSRP
jgi:DHA2 family multidrug resistance protein-like MFS transporter